MILRGIIEEIIDRYTVRVRIPSLDGVKSSTLFTDTKNLNIAVISTLPGCRVNACVGDIVFVGFETSGAKRPFIVGYLYREGMSGRNCDIVAQSIEATDKVWLSSNTTIGNVTPSEISTLSGATSNLQLQINALNERIAFLEKMFEYTDETTEPDEPTEPTEPSEPDEPETPTEQETPTE